VNHENELREFLFDVRVSELEEENSMPRRELEEARRH